MPRRERIIIPGACYHVCNRGLARRTIFESERDMRVFLACLVRAVKLGLIELLAYVIMATHFHALVRDCNRTLSRALQTSQARFVEWFNRSRARDGSLFRGRFWSGRVESSDYARMLVRYIHSNPVAAGIVSDEKDYPFSSARHYASEYWPSWLSRGALLGQGLVPLPRELSSDAAFVVERSAFSSCEALGFPTDMVRSSVPHVREWMLAHAALADGTRPGIPVVGPCVVGGVIGSTDCEPELVAGLWKLGCGLAQVEIAERMAISQSKVHRLLAVFRRRMQCDPEFGEKSARLLRVALAALYE
jgi:REP element-mobilizing transposase RayT